MTRRVYSFEDPDRFVAGATGKPGSRRFYLQAHEGTTIVSVLIEKVQVAVLAERLRALLDEVRSRGADVPAETPAESHDEASLDEPIVEAFRVGTMAIVWDGDDESVVVEARAMSEDEDQDVDPDAEAEVDQDVDEDAVDEEADVLRVRLDPGRALVFAQQALDVVAAGRPPCPFCGQPLNPEGHICARRNGFMH
jgi:uncharacterized repeat protein (TIGR03847 family)